MCCTLKHRYSNWQHAEYPTNEPDLYVTNRKRITIQLYQQQTQRACKTNSEHEEIHRYQVKPQILHYAMQLGGAA